MELSSTTTSLSVYTHSITYTYTTDNTRSPVCCTSTTVNRQLYTWTTVVETCQNGAKTVEIMTESPRSRTIFTTDHGKIYSGKQFEHGGDERLSSNTQPYI